MELEKEEGMERTVPRGAGGQPAGRCPSIGTDLVNPEQIKTVNEHTLCVEAPPVALQSVGPDSAADSC